MVEVRHVEAIITLVPIETAVLLQPLISQLGSARSAII